MMSIERICHGDLPVVFIFMALVMMLIERICHGDFPVVFIFMALVTMLIERICHGDLPVVFIFMAWWPCCATPVSLMPFCSLRSC